MTSSFPSKAGLYDGRSREMRRRKVRLGSTCPRPDWWSPRRRPGPTGKPERPRRQGRCHLRQRRPLDQKSLVSPDTKPATAAKLVRCFKSRRCCDRGLDAQVRVAMFRLVTHQQKPRHQHKSCAENRKPGGNYVPVVVHYSCDFNSHSGSSRPEFHQR